jgi:hypothetical protein
MRTSWFCLVGIEIALLVGRPLTMGVEMKKKEKGFWAKKAERHPSGAAARARAGLLRLDEHVAHVQVTRAGDDWVVTYAVAKWYLEELDRSVVRL